MLFASVCPTRMRNSKAFFIQLNFQVWLGRGVFSFQESLKIRFPPLSPPIVSFVQMKNKTPDINMNMRVLQGMSQKHPCVVINASHGHIFLGICCPSMVVRCGSVQLQEEMGSSRTGDSTVRD